MDLSVASSLHGNKITADKDLEKSLSLKSEILRGLLCMLVLVTTDVKNKYMDYTTGKMAWHTSKHM